MTAQAKLPVPAWLLFIAGAILVVQFAALSIWQINRGLEKRADRAAFANRTSFAQFRHGTEVRPYQAIEVDGHFDSERQFLIDNIILNARYGFYVLTAFEIAEDEPLLIVNRGWIEKSGRSPDLAAIAGRIAVTDSRLTVRGRASSLPKAGSRTSEAIRSRDSWPQVAAFPTTQDLALSLSRDVEALVLLMDPGEEHGFLRHWVRKEMGPGKHFGYALQWFAMGAALAGLLIWNFRKRRPDA